MKRKIFTIILTSFIVSLVLIPQVAKAQVYGSIDDCNNAGKDSSIKPWVPKNNGIKLQINIPGVATAKPVWGLQFVGASVECVKQTVYYVKDLQTYISQIYKFFIGAIALASVVVIMIGGLQYVLAAGSAAKIGTAKSLIGGALGGLAISLLSFTLLNTINPKIVNLEITNIESVVKIDTGLFCKDLPKASLNGPKADGTIGTLTKKDVAICGQKYHTIDKKSKKVTQQSCLGTICGSSLTCFEGECKKIFMKGKITFADDSKDAFIDNNLELWVLCEEELFAGSTTQSRKRIIPRKVFTQDLPGKLKQTSANFEYRFGGKVPAAVCAGGNFAKELGFFLKADINDPGIFESDDWYAFDNTCKKALFSCKGPVPTCVKETDPAEISWSFIATKAGDLISPSDMRSADPVECNIHIDRNEFFVRK